VARTSVARDFNAQSQQFGLERHSGKERRVVNRQLDSRPSRPTTNSPAIEPNARPMARTPSAVRVFPAMPRMS
jgi:hypothetical protein